MGIPVVFAEFIVVTELFILLSQGENLTPRKWNRLAGIIVGFYFSGKFVYLLFNAFIPLTVSGGWRGPSDFISVSFYFVGVVPLLGLALMGLGVLCRDKDERSNLRMHATFVAIFLVVAHIAMVFGMLNPTVLM